MVSGDVFVALRKSLELEAVYRGTGFSLYQSAEEVTNKRKSQSYQATSTT